jgi:hypothetical protein
MRSALTDTALQDLYTPTPDDLTFMEHATTSPVAAFGGLVLKTFQRSGSLLSFAEVPPRLLRHLATATGVLLPHDCLQQEEQRGLRQWHLPLIRHHLGMTAFRDGGWRVGVGAMLAAARRKDILAASINVGIAALVHARYALPAFSTLRRAAQPARRWLRRDAQEGASPWPRRTLMLSYPCSVRW